MTEICPTCKSAKLSELGAEMIIHFSGLKNLDNPGVLLSPKVSVCLDCGFSRFSVPETELASVAKGTSETKSSALLKSSGDAALGNEIAC